MILRRSVGLLLMTLAAAMPGCQSAPKPASGPFLFVRTSPSNSAAFLAQTASCSRDSRTFRQIVDTLVRLRPLLTQVVISSEVVLGTPGQSRTGAPLLQVDLADFRQLPELADVRGWAEDSNWALTRCELFAHEIAEGFYYRNAIAAAGAQTRAGLPDSVSLAIALGSHSKAMDAELQVAIDQTSRKDSLGVPYGRSGFCIHGDVYYLTVGGSTEAWILAGPDDPLARVAYFHGQLVCSDPHWKDSAEALMTRIRAQFARPASGDSVGHKLVDKD